MDLEFVRNPLKILCLLALFACSSFGSTIEFTDTTVASGTIGTTSFTGAPITIMAVGNTGGIQSFAGGLFINDSEASVTIQGVGISVGSLLLSLPLALRCRNAELLRGLYRNDG